MNYNLVNKKINLTIRLDAGETYNNKWSIAIL